MNGYLSSLYVVQKEAVNNGSDFRVMVSDNKPVIVIVRFKESGDFISTRKENYRKVHQLGGCKDVEELAVSASNALGLKFSGIDIIEDQGVLKVLEVNASPGLKIPYRLTGFSYEYNLLKLALDELNKVK